MLDGLELALLRCHDNCDGVSSMMASSRACVWVGMPGMAWRCVVVVSGVLSVVLVCSLAQTQRFRTVLLGTPLHRNFISQTRLTQCPSVLYMPLLSPRSNSGQPQSVSAGAEGVPKINTS
jgi:hypothetical protein